MQMLKTTLLFILALTYLKGDLLAESEDGQPKKRALIFGVTGQDGAYLSDFLLKKNYEVHGVKRRSSSINTGRVEQFIEKNNSQKPAFFLHFGDVTDSASVINLISLIKPDEIYNLAAQSHVKVSFDLPEYTAEVDALGTLRILEAIRILGLEKKTKFYQASTSELYGLVQEIPQNEKTPFYPRSPYGVAKLYAYWITVNYREAYNIFACNGILFNHESPLREETFVTRKITLAACRYKMGLSQVLALGNLDSERDWGFAEDYVKAMWLMLQQERADDYVVATGTKHTVREFVQAAYKEVGVDIEWQGKDENEIGLDKKTKEVIIRVDPSYFRPTEVELLIGDASKAEDVLGWIPTTNFEELVKIMIQSDLELIAKEKLYLNHSE